MAIVDTTFLIDLMKESKARRRGMATAKLDDLIRRGESLRLAVFSIGELYVGVAKGTQPVKERAAIEECLELFDVVGFGESTARVFGAVVGNLERQRASDLRYGRSDRQRCVGTRRVGCYPQCQPLSTRAGVAC